MVSILHIQYTCIYIRHNIFLLCVSLAAFPVSVHLVMRLESEDWSSRFLGHIRLPAYFRFSRNFFPDQLITDASSSSSNSNRIAQKRSLRSKINKRSKNKLNDVYIDMNTLNSKSVINSNMAICTAIPYTSSNAEKARTNGALIREWIRYYIKLGIRVIIYDNKGQNYESIVNDTDGVSLNRDEYMSSPLLHYHNYTIRPRLLGEHSVPMNAMIYDNEEQNAEEIKAIGISRKTRYNIQGMCVDVCRFVIFFRFNGCLYHAYMT
jgi:hypothetical protein